MCYSTALRKTKDQVEENLKTLEPVFKHPEVYEPYYHRNGFSRQNLFIIKMDEPDTIYPAIWGLVPDFAVDRPDEYWKKANTLNAKGENIYETLSYRNSANEKRCLILADGFFEPHHENNVAIPYFCYQPNDKFIDGDLFLFAGLYNELDDSEENKSFTTTILTVEANDFFADIHNKKKRMPLVLDENYWQDWLDFGMNRQQINDLIFTGFTSKKFSAHPVSRDLYKKGIDTNKPYIIEEVEKGTLF